MKLRTLALALSAAALLAPAQAAVVVLTSEAAFLSKLGSYGTDSFDDMIADAPVEAPVRTANTFYFNRTAGSYGYRLDVGTWYPTFNNRDADDPSDVRLSPENAARALNFTNFVKPVFGIGANFFITDVWGVDMVGQAIKLTLTDINNVVTNLTVTNTTDSTYRGFLSTVAIKSLSVIADKPLEDKWATVNNLTIGTIPEPGTLLLSVLSLAALLTCRRSQTSRA